MKIQSDELPGPKGVPFRIVAEVGDATLGEAKEVAVWLNEAAKRVSESLLGQKQ